MEKKQLTRKTATGVFGGVCAGMADYLGIDVTLMRILWVVAAIVSRFFLFVIAYIVLWAVLPAADGKTSGRGPLEVRTEGVGRKGVVWISAALIGLGVYLLLRELLPFEFGQYLFGAGLIAAGALLIWTTTRPKS